MSSNRQDDRAWNDAVDRYVATAQRPRRPRTNNGRYVLASAFLLVLAVSPFAVGATGSVIREGKRNPGSGSATRETELISRSKTYGTRQSNVLSGNGGGAIYGCRSNPSREACIRSNNLSEGRAFEFETDGAEGGRIETKTETGRPFTTNATGVATGLNADRVDGMHAAKVDFRAPINTPATRLLELGGLVLTAACGPGPDLDVRATTTVAHSALHVSWNKDPGNVPFYRQDNDLNPNESFSLLAQNDDGSQGTVVYTSPAGVSTSVTFLGEEADAFGATAACAFTGTAMAG
ncbi:MAG TPA: hypothetical protein VFB51_03175 [Solirubrobacterales bacterium]|nr:hypothetical protein [Solirubrobacterales bacterium]